MREQPRRAEIKLASHRRMNSSPQIGSASVRRHFSVNLELHVIDTCAPTGQQTRAPPVSSHNHEPRRPQSLHQHSPRKISSTSSPTITPQDRNRPSPISTSAPSRLAAIPSPLIIVASFSRTSPDRPDRLILPHLHYGRSRAPAAPGGPPHVDPAVTVTSRTAPARFGDKITSASTGRSEDLPDVFPGVERDRAACSAAEGVATASDPRVRTSHPMRMRWSAPKRSAAAKRPDELSATATTRCVRPSATAGVFYDTGSPATREASLRWLVKAAAYSRS